mmetsp:Transcript_3625/g.13007  ORF Transcript_3625/g.13007 Transcript_3625/m.13007 type:complete len:783 (+) Transcript_3625:202-2550(+)
MRHCWKRLQNVTTRLCPSSPWRAGATCHASVGLLSCLEGTGSSPRSSSSVPGLQHLKPGESVAVNVPVGPRALKFETGKLARLADSAVTVTYGDTSVLTTVIADRTFVPTRDFLPLQVDYRERAFAVGRIPNTYTKREGAPKDREVLTARVIDRSIRPLFPKGFYYETQVLANLLFADTTQDPDMLCINAASAALTISDIPWEGPIGCVRVARVNNKLIVNPDIAQLQQSDLDVIYAATPTRTIMIEAQCNEVPNDEMEKALRFAHAQAKRLIEPQLQLKELVGRRKQKMRLAGGGRELAMLVRHTSAARIASVLRKSTHAKEERARDRNMIAAAARDAIMTTPDIERLDFDLAFDEVFAEEYRKAVRETGKRIDGRKVDEIRPIYCKAGELPVVHGSSLFERGNTQALCTVTIGGSDEKQKLDSAVGPADKSFIFHYGFPPCATNEVKKVGSQNRREIGHGMLAEKSLVAVTPSEEAFPFSLRVWSETLQSDGSSSMAAVCGGSLALHDAGVPMKAHVAGISIGSLLSNPGASEGNSQGDYVLLTDILGMEDHHGDMDFKVAGSRKGITAIQLDVKPAGVPLDMLVDAMEASQKARLQILELMEKELPRPRESVSDDAPHFGIMTFERDAISKIIGPGGTTLHALEAKFPGSSITVHSDKSEVHLFGINRKVFESARGAVGAIAVPDIEIGKVYKGVVVGIQDYGATIRLEPSQKQGMLHVSDIAHIKAVSVGEVLELGQEVTVLCTDRDQRGNLKLSMKELSVDALPKSLVKLLDGLKSH